MSKLVKLINRRDYRTKNAMAKITVVEKAATDTPEKPFGENKKRHCKNNSDRKSRDNIIDLSHNITSIS
ncbi:uncharacterized protein EAE97_001232 [Botrytis byssoidea]|uniref:Uncharacterized protein n=1 Tax=Botrytis byssoidea TaxID=139641 RepID=A0A9P5IXV3_9HELO|nr:uncharacterized protein EAE97_001232 [Botrytis byssoidea]KAF7953833.1 hypothetical protein EAE97_001232 [Botrytis byssoidea]